MADAFALARRSPRVGRGRLCATPSRMRSRRASTPSRFAARSAGSRAQPAATATLRSRTKTVSCAAPCSGAPRACSISTPRDGDQVEVRGRLAVYEPRGDLQTGGGEPAAGPGRARCSSSSCSARRASRRKACSTPARKRALPDHAEGDRHRDLAGRCRAARRGQRACGGACRTFRSCWHRPPCRGPAAPGRTGALAALALRAASRKSTWSCWCAAAARSRTLWAFNDECAGPHDRRKARCRSSAASAMKPTSPSPISAPIFVRRPHRLPRPSSCAAPRELWLAALGACSMSGCVAAFSARLDSHGTAPRRCSFARLARRPSGAGCCASNCGWCSTWRSGCAMARLSKLDPLAASSRRSKPCRPSVPLQFAQARHGRSAGSGWRTGGAAIAAARPGAGAASVATRGCHGRGRQGDHQRAQHLAPGDAVQREAGRRHVPNMSVLGVGTGTSRRAYYDASANDSFLECAVLRRHHHQPTCEQ